jgi:chaperonin GroEL (HSP60 family)
VRLAQLAGRVCANRVGGASSLDTAERMYKMKSALHSAAAARKSGVAPGGGTALFKAGRVLRIGSAAAKIRCHSLCRVTRGSVLPAFLLTGHRE